MGEDEAPFPVVGLGSSAGGLQALSELFAELPADPGMAFVVVQHLSPEHRSKLSSILAGSNLMPVLDVEDGVEIERNKVYVIPPSSFPTIEDGRLHVADQQGESHGFVIDVLHLAGRGAGRAGGRGRALRHANRRVAGLRRLREHGGVAVVQDPASAAFDGMPRAAIDGGVADFVLEAGEKWSRRDLNPGGRLERAK